MDSFPVLYIGFMAAAATLLVVILLIYAAFAVQ